MTCKPHRSRLGRHAARLSLLTVAMLTLAVLFAYPATANRVSVRATINGGGTAAMQPPLAAGTTHWGAGIKLYSDGTASGSFDCVDQHGDTPGFPGNIWGHVTSWSGDLHGIITLNVVGKVVGFPGGHPQDVSFTVTIQRFGGAGVGQWTLSLGTATACFETLLSGQIVMQRS